MIYKNFIIKARLGGLTPDQTNLFTNSHEKFYLTITITDTKTGERTKRRTTYQYNPSAVRYNENDGIYTVASDALCYADSPGFHDFCLAFDFSPNSPKALGAFKSCRASMAFFEKVGLSIADIVAIRDSLD